MKQEVEAEDYPIKAVLPARPTVPHRLIQRSWFTGAGDFETRGKVAGRGSRKGLEDDAEWPGGCFDIDTELAQQRGVAAKGIPLDRVAQLSGQHRRKRQRSAVYVTSIVGAAHA